MNTIAACLAWGEKMLSSHATGRLDAQLLLAFVLKSDRAYLYTWPQKEMTFDQREAFEKIIYRRQQNEPIAYIIGYKEFWSLPFEVTPATLIPRPDTELLIEVVLARLPETPLQIVDLGTGSGIIACALQKTRPRWECTAVDKDHDTLLMAKKNAASLKLNTIEFVQSNWLSAFQSDCFNAIVSNPPYLKQNDSYLQKELLFEPRGALVAGESGLEALQAIVHQSLFCLKARGLLALEHGCDQAEAVRFYLKKAGFVKIKTYQDLAGLDRVTVASLSERLMV